MARAVGANNKPLSRFRSAHRAKGLATYQHGAEPHVYGFPMHKGLKACPNHELVPTRRMVTRGIKRRATRSGLSRFVCVEGRNTGLVWHAPLAIIN